MTRMERHTVKKPLFWKVYLVYLLVIALAFVGIFIYVRGIMTQYENNSPENYVVWLAKDASENSELGKYLEEHNFSDKRFGNAETRKADFYDTIKNAELKSIAAKGSYDSISPVYDVTADGKPFMTIGISEQGNTTKLGIMTLSDWKIDYCILRNGYFEDSIKLGEDGKLDYTIKLPENYTLMIDNEEANIESSGLAELAEFEYIYPFAKAPQAKVYELNDVEYEPYVTASRGGEDVLGFEKQTDGSYSVLPEFSPSIEAKELCDSVCNPLEIGKTWSKFMTDDVEGPSHGLNTVIAQCRILKGTNLYDMANKWAHNVDITFVSGHTITSWTNESVTNHIKYNDNLFSCDVSFDKNMNLARGAGKRTDEFRNRMFFGNVNGAWYLLDMMTLE
ncbi:MAG: hypothetical protein Q4F55_00690 [Bacillota bacterium]|nr:hypothetical protein [Bacillota bacterium]